MKYTYLQAILWIALYVVIALSPLLLVVAGPLQEGRGFWIEFGVALGFVGLSMLCMQFVITGRFRHLAMGFGSDNLLHFHTATGITAMLLILAHPAILLTVEPAYTEYLDPSVNLPRVLALVPGTVSVVLLVILSLWRTRFRLVYEWWRLSHGALATLVVFVGLVHILQVGHHTSLWWQKAYVVALVVTAIGAVMNVRVVRPLRMKKRPWEVVEVIEERAGATTLVLEPRGHDGFDFRAGQYAWITLGKSPFSLQQHPFSFANGEGEGTRVVFTSKPTGDFTSTWRDIKPGESAFLEGPFGAFTPRKRTRNLLLVAGGVGVTPIMSMLRTLATRGDKREIVMIYANRSWNDIIFREELEGLQTKLSLRVEHVLSDPDDDWEGQRGYLNHEVLKKVFPEDLENYDAYLCGPEPMLNIVEAELAPSVIPLPRIMSERFQIV